MGFLKLISEGIRLQILCSLVSFVATLIKILDDGLNTYCAMPGFSKRIADIIRQYL